MKKFEVCIRGSNFLIQSGNQVKRNGFYAARFIEADDMSGALDIVMNSIKAELKDVVLNDKSNPPKVSVEDIYEVYYFGDKIVWEGKNLPPAGFVWDEEVVKEAASPPAGSLSSPLEGKWSTLWKRIRQKDIHVHTIFIHFTNSLYPVAILFMFLFLLSGNASFHQTFFYMMVLATFSVPVSYLTGVLEWRKRFKGIMIPIFASKIKYGPVMFVIGGCSTLWHYLSPGILERGDLLSVVYVLFTVSIMLPLIYLGHLGGIIVYEGVE
ncbi:MAG TPA: DUF2231 domain-containing protein [Nitrospirota bacterium]